MKKLIAFIFSLFLCSVLYGQDANLEAKVLYNKAEEAYNSGKFQETLKDLSAIEDIPGNHQFKNSLFKGKYLQ
jgi:outer membrane protein assembly factor BamD (BamD/ComL family)